MAAQITQTELGRLVGLTRSSVANLEAGRQSSSAERAVELAKTFKVSVQWLLTGDDTVEIPVPTEPPIERRRLYFIAEDLRGALAEIEKAIPDFP